MSNLSLSMSELEIVIDTMKASLAILNIGHYTAEDRQRVVTKLINAPFVFSVELKRENDSAETIRSLRQQLAEKDTLPRMQDAVNDGLQHRLEAAQQRIEELEAALEGLLAEEDTFMTDHTRYPSLGSWGLARSELPLWLIEYLVEHQDEDITAGTHTCESDHELLVLAGAKAAVREIEQYLEYERVEFGNPNETYLVIAKSKLQRIKAELGLEGKDE